MSMMWTAIGGIGSAVIGGGLSYLGSRNQNKTTGTQNYGNSYGGQWGQQGMQNWGLNSWTPNAGLNDSYLNLFGQINGLSNTPMQYYPGQGYVDASKETRQGVNLLTGTLGDYKKGAAALRASAGQMQPFLQQQAQNYKFLSTAADVANNPYVQGQIAANERSVNENLQRSLLPQLQSGSVGVNNLGSSRLGLAQGQAIGDTSKGLANTNAAYLSNAYQQGLGAQQAALGMTGQLMQNTMLPGQAYAGAAGLMGQGANNMLQAGSINEGYEQKKLDDAMARWNFAQQEPWMRANNLSSLLGGLQYTGEGRTNNSGYGTSYGGSYGGQNQSQMEPNPNYMSPYQAILGGASAGYGLYNQFSPYFQGAGGGSYGGYPNSWWGGPNKSNPGANWWD
jgi:hypothetical protein